MSLDAIADDMKRRAQTSGHASALLPRGLRIRYEINGPNRRLAIARQDVPPSINERQIVAKAFGVASKDWHSERKFVRAHSVHLFVADLQWLAESEE